MSTAEKEKFKRSKQSSKRINYNHKRSEAKAKAQNYKRK